MNYIYKLIDPRDHLIRYVGKTKDPATREKSHFSYRGGNKNKDNWIDGLRAESLHPILEIIEEVEGLRETKRQESYWIYTYLDQDFPLLNDLGAIERAYRRK